MRTRTALVGASLVAVAAACSLTTSLDGLSTGASAPLDGGSSADAADAAAADATAAGGDGAVDGSAGEAGALGYRETVLADSPLAYYRFEDTGTVAKDETGAHDGTYKGAVTHAPGALATGASMAAVFDGSTTWIEVGDVLPFTGNAPFTLEAWASPVPGASDPMCMVAKTFAPGGATGGVADGYAFFADDTTNALRFSRFVGSAATGPGGPTIATQRFTHVVATYDGTNGVIFVDGVRKESSASSAALVNVTSPLTIGAGRGGVYCFFRGALDEVAVYGTALPDARVLAHYAAGVAK
jgi:hypothetical protein